MSEPLPTIDDMDDFEMATGSDGDLAVLAEIVAEVEGVDAALRRAEVANLRAPLDQVQQPGRPSLVPHWGEFDDHGHELLTEPGVTPDMLIDTDRGDPIGPGGIIDQTTTAFGEDGVVRGAPRHPEPCRNPCDREVIDDNSGQRPLQPCAGDLRPWTRGTAGVLPPRPAAVGAPVPAHPDQQRRWPVPERRVREPTRHRVPRNAPSATSPTPRIRLREAALDHR